MQDAERFAIFFGGADILGQCDFGFSLKNGERGAQFVGSVGNEAALAFESGVETIEQAVESCGEAPEFIARVLNGQAIVDGKFADVVGAGSHIRDGSETFAREEVTASGREENRERNEPCESDADIFQEFAFGMERGENHETVGLSCCREGTCIAANAATFRWESAKESWRHIERRQACLQGPGRNFRTGVGVTLRRSAWQVAGHSDGVATGGENGEGVAGILMFQHGLARGSGDAFRCRGVA